MNQEHETVDWPEDWPEDRRMELREAMSARGIEGEDNFAAMALDVDRQGADTVDLVRYLDHVQSSVNRHTELQEAAHRWRVWYICLIDDIRPYGHYGAFSCLFRLGLTLLVGIPVWPVQRVCRAWISWRARSVRQGIYGTFAEWIRRRGVIGVKVEKNPEKL